EQHAEWQRVMRAGVGTYQKVVRNRESRTQAFRIFESTVIPGLLQTSDYARGCIEPAVEPLGLPDDIEEAVVNRMRRQDILYQQDKRFHILTTEAALRFRQVPPAQMLPQLDRLIAISGLRNVKLGVIGFNSRVSIGP